MQRQVDKFILKQIVTTASPHIASQLGDFFGVGLLNAAQMVMITRETFDETNTIIKISDELDIPLETAASLYEKYKDKLALEQKKPPGKRADSMTIITKVLDLSYEDKDKFFNKEPTSDKLKSRDDALKFNSIVHKTKMGKFIDSVFSKQSAGLLIANGFVYMCPPTAMAQIGAVAVVLSAQQLIKMMSDNNFEAAMQQTSSNRP